MIIVSFFVHLAGNEKLAAQDTTHAVPQGVIKVKRSSVPAAYRVEVQSAYLPKARKRSHIARFSRKEIVITDTLYGVIPPQPLDVKDERLADSTGNYLRAKERPPFAWNAFVSDMGFTFAWSDSVRSDSARFQFTISRKGVVKMKPLPWKNADSTSLAFENKANDKLKMLMYWYPARVSVSKRRQKMRAVDSVVIVTIYAYDPNAGRLLPIEEVK